jgi:hypothetical protein
MPTIKIIYSREHFPPHFHALYAEFEELIEIDSLDTYAGKLPIIQRKKVVDWAKNHKDYLLSVFKQLNPEL